MKPDTWLETLNCAIEGILEAVRSQRHMRWHSVACLVILVLAPRLSVTPGEFALLCLAAAMVLVAELLNTSVESAVDLACAEYHPLARVAKDVAAGAVLVASFAAAAVGWVVLIPKVGAVIPGMEPLRREPVVVVSTLLAVLVVVVLLKALTSRGRPLHGGFPSGHAAMAAALATLLVFHTRDPMVGILGAALAAMVSHSRLLLKVHSLAEVLIGGALGAALAGLLAWVIG